MLQSCKLLDAASNAPTQLNFYRKYGMQCAYHANKPTCGHADGWQAGALGT